MREKSLALHISHVNNSLLLPIPIPDLSDSKGAWPANSRLNLIYIYKIVNLYTPRNLSTQYSIYCWLQRNCSLLSVSESQLKSSNCWRPHPSSVVWLAWPCCCHLPPPTPIPFQVCFHSLAISVKVGPHNWVPPDEPLLRINTWNLLTPTTYVGVSLMKSDSQTS